MIRLYQKYMKPYLIYVIATVTITIFEYALQVFFLVPESKKIIDNGVLQQNDAAIRQSGIIMLVLTVLIGICTVFTAYFSAKATAGFVCHLRKACFEKVNQLSPQDFAVFGESTLVNRTMTDITQLQLMTINALRVWLILPVLLILELTMIAMINIRIFFVLLIFFVFTVGFMVFFGVRSKTGFEELQKKIDRINLLLKERIVGVRPIRAFGNEEYENQKTAAANQETFDAAISANNKINFISPIGLVTMSWVVVIIYLMGTSEIRTGMASVSELLLIFQYISYFVTSLLAIPFIVNMLPKVSVSVRRIRELLDYTSINRIGQDKEKAQETETTTKGSVEFRNVIFGYSGAIDVIADVSFLASPGTTTALIGATGSGKTTIVNLLQGLYQPTFGDILINGKSIHECSDSELRQTFSYSTQRPMIFSDTVRNNITNGDPQISDEQVMKVCDAACFTEILEQHPEGLDLMLSQGGMNLSGGQRQRLSIARALARPAQVYIFDDSFSALDAKTEEKVLGAVYQLLKDKTVIMIAQKISTIKNADNIIVLDKGRIVGQGKHDELLKSCTPYIEIYQTQCYLDKEG